MAADYLKEFGKLLMKAPKINVPISKCENCDYNIFLFASKNCYLCRGSSYLEDCMHCDISVKCKDTLDCSYSYGMELSYDCMMCRECYNCAFSDHCRFSRDLNYCSFCQSCNDCFGCVGLQRKEYYIFNKPYPKEKYFEEVAKLKHLLRGEIEKRMEPLQLANPHQYYYGQNNEHSAGNYMSNCKSCFNCYGTGYCEDCVNIYEETLYCKDCVDVTHTHRSELCYKTSSVDQCYNCNFIFWGENCRDCEYGYCIHNCENCFMCTNLRAKQYHILNEPYSKEAYFKKTAAIKDQLLSCGTRGEHLIYLALKDTPEIAQYFN